MKWLKKDTWLMIRKMALLVLAVLSLVFITACNNNTRNKGVVQDDVQGMQEEPDENNNSFFTELNKEDIVILFTTDVHHKLTEYIGYDGLMAVKKDVLEVVPDKNLIMVDCGDCLDGGNLGEYMENVGELVIHKDGEISSGLLHVSEYLKKDAETTEYLEQLKAEAEE